MVNKLFIKKMNASEFRKLIREEVRKIVNEADLASSTSFESFLNESLKSGPNDAYTYPIKIGRAHV